jgi:hypothetical protein
MTSVFLSAFTILFLLVFLNDFEKINGNFPRKEFKTMNVILGSSFVGALAYTFLDSFGTMQLKPVYILPILLSYFFLDWVCDGNKK